MSEPEPPQIEIAIEEISGGQVVIGDHTMVQTTAGAKVTVLQMGERPVPRLRSLPVDVRPAAAQIFGREREIAAAAGCAAGSPLQIYAPEGAGKTALLKAVAKRVEAPPEGTVFLGARRRSLDEIQLRLYEAFWECDVPFLPSTEQVGGFLAEREALLVLDDCGLDRDDLELLMDAVPRSNLVLASGQRTLWSRGRALPLDGLGLADALDLLERELGRSVEPSERDAARAVAERTGGRPQALVEAAALVADSAASLREIAANPASLARLAEPSSLTPDQAKLLALLAPLGGAPLGSRGLAELSGVSDAAERLRELERRGWVKASSPRYRLVRPLSPGADRGADAKIGERLLKHLTAWSRTASPAEVAEEADAVRATLRVGAGSDRWRGSVDLARAAEWKLTVAGSWTAAWQTMRAGLGAARQLGDESAEAHFLHQHGSLSLCTADREQAASQLAQALAIRERLGEPAAELTRHNLEQLGGGPPGGKGNGSGPDGDAPWRPPVWATLGIVAGVLGLVLAMTLFAGGSPLGLSGDTTEGDDPTRSDPGTGGRTGTGLTDTTGSTGRTADTEATDTGDTEPTDTTDRPLGDPPLIRVSRPRETSYAEGETITAKFHCPPAPGGDPVESCTATLDGSAIQPGDVLDTSPGEHAFVVKAVDVVGRPAEKSIPYTVEAAPPEDETPPVITIVVPKDGKKYLFGSETLADFRCVDAVYEEVECVGTVPDGGLIDTTVGSHTFVVKTRDPAGNADSAKVEYFGTK